MYFRSRRICAMLLLFMAITGLVMSFGENVLCAGELPGAHETAGTAHEQDLSQLHGNACPDSPSPTDSTNDHFCIGDCGCPCQAPLTASVLSLTYTHSFTYLYPVEITRHTPEVYLSLFVPPDSAAA